MARGQGHDGSPSRLLGVVAALVLGAALTACSDGHVVSSDSQQLYLKVPSSWTVFDEHELSKDGAFGSLFTSAPIFAAIAFGTKHARPGDAFTPTGYPWAIVVVRPLSGAEQSQMSLNGLRDVLFNVDTLQTEGANVQVAGLRRRSWSKAPSTARWWPTRYRAPRRARPWLMNRRPGSTAPPTRCGS